MKKKLKMSEEDFNSAYPNHPIKIENYPNVGIIPYNSNKLIYFQNIFIIFIK